MSQLVERDHVKAAAQPEGEVYELLDLSVHEVSLVDKPAIGRRYLITKRMEGDVAKKKTTEKQAPAAEAEAEDKDESEDWPAAEADADTEGQADDTAPSEDKREDIKKPADADGDPPADAAKADEAEPADDAKDEPDDPETTTIVTPPSRAEALKALTDEMDGLALPARVALKMLERNIDGDVTKQDDPFSFDDQFQQMTTGSNVWGAFDALMTVVFNVLDSQDENKLASVKAVIGDFQKKLMDVLTTAGVKTDPEPDPDAVPVETVKLGDEDVTLKGASPFEVEVLEAVAAIGERLNTVDERLSKDQGSDGDDAEVAQKSVDDEPDEKKGLTSAEVMKMVKDGIAEARRPQYKALRPVADKDDDDGDAEAVRASRTGEHAGLSELKRTN